MSSKSVLSLALLITWALLGDIGRAQAGYVSPQAAAPMSGAEGRFAGDSSMGEASLSASSQQGADEDSGNSDYGNDAPVPPGKFPVLLSTLCPHNGGAGAGSGAGSFSGASGAQVPLLSSPMIPLSVVVARLFIEKAFYPSTPQVSSLFRPPRAGV